MERVDETKFSLGETYFNSLKQCHDRILLYIADTNEAITYSEVFSQSVRAALKMKKMGVIRNDIISTWTHSQKHSLVPIFAAQFLGAISSNFDPYLSQTEAIHLLKLIEPRILFVSEEALQFVSNCVEEADVKTELVVFGSIEGYSQFSDYLQPDNEEQNFCPVKVNEAETALILFSSGTTGLPKGICLSHRSFKFDANKEINSTPTVTLTFLTYNSISTHMNLIRTVTNGNAIVMCKKVETALVWKIIEKYKVFYVFLPPSHARECLKTKPKNVNVDSVRFVGTGSCFVTKKLMEDLKNAFPNAYIANIYHQTEFGATLICFFYPFEEQMKRPLSSGKIQYNIPWKIVDLKTGQTLGPNEEGELRVKHESFMNGYYKMDCSSAYDSEGYLKTGDIFYYDEEKYLYIVDRIRNIFKYRTWQVIPSIIEDVLKSHPAVKEAVVIGMPHEEDTNHPMGVVVLHENYDNMIVGDILNYANERLHEYHKLRAGLKIVNSIPKTVTGKTKRSEVVKSILEQ